MRLPWGGSYPASGKVPAGAAFTISPFSVLRYQDTHPIMEDIHARLETLPPCIEYAYITG